MKTSTYFETQSSELSCEIAFYKAVFGWKFVSDPHIPISYYRSIIKCSTSFSLTPMRDKRIAAHPNE